MAEEDPFASLILIEEGGQIRSYRSVVILIEPVDAGNALMGVGEYARGNCPMVIRSLDPFDGRRPHHELIVGDYGHLPP